MKSFRTLFAATLVAFGQQAVAAPDAPARSTVVSVFDGDALVLRAALPPDASTEILSDASVGGDGDHPASFTGNVVMTVTKEGRRVMTLSGDRMELERAPAR